MQKPFGRPRQHPGIASAGEHVCRRPYYNRSGKLVKVCKRPVPAGELPHLAWNDPSGQYLALCLPCRNELSDVLAYWFGAGLGTARLMGQLLSSKSGMLVSERTLRQLLVDHGFMKAARHGPLTSQEKALGLSLFVSPSGEEREPSDPARPVHHETTGALVGYVVDGHFIPKVDK